MKTLLTILILAITASAQTPSSEFKTPWKDSNTTFVLDPFGPNKLDFDELATEKRVTAIIHKASDCVARGKTCVQRTDNKYIDRRDEARRRGYLWGSYHLGGPGNPIKQADDYLDFAKPAADEVMALDLEDISPQFMSIREAAVFVARVKERTGRYPMVYITGKIKAAIESNPELNRVFINTPLWYARYLNDIGPFFPGKIWKTYALWQFQSEINCCTKRPRRCPQSPSLKTCTSPKPIAGTEFDMDVNVFFGDAAKLKASWPFTFAEDKK